VGESLEQRFVMDRKCKGFGGVKIVQSSVNFSKVFVLGTWLSRLSSRSRDVPGDKRWSVKLEGLFYALSSGGSASCKIRHAVLNFPRNSLYIRGTNFTIRYLVISLSATTRLKSVVIPFNSLPAVFPILCLQGLQCDTVPSTRANHCI
jgi:hypothetical protein